MNPARPWACLIGVAVILAVPVTAARSQEHGGVADRAVEAAHGDAEHGDEVHGEEHGEASPLTWQTDAAIWTAVVFLVLFLVLYKFAWKHIAAGLDRREQGIADNIAAAQRSNEEAKQLLGEYQKRLDAVQDEIRAIIEEARRDGEHTQREILAKANQEAEVIRSRAMREIETATAQALKELADHATNLAIELAGKIVSAELDQSRHTHLIQEAMTRFDQPEPSQN